MATYTDDDGVRYTVTTDKSGNPKYIMPAGQHPRPAGGGLTLLLVSLVVIVGGLALIVALAGNGQPTAVKALQAINAATGPAVAEPQPTAVPLMVAPARPQIVAAPVRVEAPPVVEEPAPTAAPVVTPAPVFAPAPVVAPAPPVPTAAPEGWGAGGDGWGVGGGTAKPEDNWGQGGGGGGGW